MSQGGPGQTASPASERPLLLQRNFASLWWGQLISILGERLNFLALNGLLLQHTRGFADLGQSSILLGMLGTVMLLPVLMFAPFVGPWVDRWNLRSTLLVSDTLRALLVMLIPIGYAATHSVSVVFAVVFVLFTCNVFFLPAKSAMTPELVGPDQLLAANTLLSVAGIVATGVGALAGGWLVDHLGWAVVMWVNAATYMVSVGSLAFIRYRARPRLVRDASEPSGYLHEVMEGLRVVRNSPAVGLALISLGAIWAGGGFLQVAGIQHIQRAASVPGTERLALLMAAFAVGAGLGTWVVNTRARTLPRPLVLGVGLLAAGGFLVALAVTTRFAVFAGAAFLIGLCAAPAFVLTETLLQEGTDLSMRGRVFSLRDFAMRGTNQVSLWVAAAATPLLGTTAALLIAATVIGGAGVLAILWGRRTPALMRRMAASPKGQDRS
jgi:MFS family permease